MKGKMIIAVVSFVLGISGVAVFTGIDVKTVDNGVCLYAAPAVDG